MPKSREKAKQEKKTVAVVGASGFAGAELLRLIAHHRYFSVVLATGDSKQGTKVGDLYPNLRLAYPTLEFVAFDPKLVADVDIVFFALPHGVSMGLIPEIEKSVDCIIDLGSDFRLKDQELYPTWYDRKHTSPELLADFSYGLPELFRSDISASKRIAATGCNAAASILALAPFIESNSIHSDQIVIDVKAGISGAGRPPKENTTFCATSENVEAYGLLTHRHTPEIEQALQACSDRASSGASGGVSQQVSVLFTPHLVPLNRGILATCYAPVTQKISTAEAVEIMKDFYADDPFVSVGQASPSTKATRGSNAVHLTARVDERTGFLITLCALDNLLKGASGMAIQCANLATGLPETTGLSTIGVSP